MTRISHFPGTRFMCSETPAGFGIRFSVNEDKSIFAKVVFDESKQGSPGFLHGGAIAAVIDEAMGTAAYEAVMIGHTATMTCNYLAPIALFEDVLIRARVTKIEGKKIFTQAEAVLQDDMIAVTATGLFIASEKLQKMIDSQSPIPENE